MAVPIHFRSFFLFSLFGPRGPDSPARSAPNDRNSLVTRTASIPPFFPSSSSSSFLFSCSSSSSHWPDTTSHVPQPPLPQPPPLPAPAKTKPNPPPLPDPSSLFRNPSQARFEAIVTIRILRLMATQHWCFFFSHSFPALTIPCSSDARGSPWQAVPFAKAHPHARPADVSSLWRLSSPQHCAFAHIFSLVFFCYQSF